MALGLDEIPRPAKNEFLVPVDAVVDTDGVPVGK